MTRDEWKSVHRAARIRNRRARQQDRRAAGDIAVRIEAELDRAIANPPPPAGPVAPLPSGRRLAALGAGLVALVLLSLIARQMIGPERPAQLIQVSAPASESAAPAAGAGTLSPT